MLFQDCCYCGCTFRSGPVGFYLRLAVVHSFIHSYSFNKKFDMSHTMTIKDTQNINTTVDERTIVNERYRLKGIGLIGLFLK